MKKLIIPILLILALPVVYGVCSQSGVAGNYSENTDVIVTITCTAVEKGDAGHIAWYNATGSLIENDTFTVPNEAPYVVYESWRVATPHTPKHNLSSNLTASGSYIEPGYKFNTTISGGKNDLDITNVETTTDIYEGKGFGITGVIENLGETVGYADICIDILDEDGYPFAHLGCTESEMDGEFFMSGICEDTWCEGGNQYILDIGASCPKNRTNEDNVCTQSDSDEISYASGETTKAITIIDMADKLIVNQTMDKGNENGVWMENAEGYRVNMTPSLPTLWQEDITWTDYNQTDGSAFLTAGEKFRVCMYINNSFSDARHITLNHLHLIRKNGSMVIPYLMTGERIDGKELMHIEIQPGIYQKCSDWLLLPDYIKGQNNWKAFFHLKDEKYDQEIELNTDRFTIFGERIDKDYVDYITINSVEFTKTNVSEGEFVQVKLNLTNNHLYKDVNIRVRQQLVSNYDPATASSRIIDTAPYNPDNWQNPDTTYFDFEGVIPSNYTAGTLLPMFKVPYGLIDQDEYDVISTSTNIFFGDTFQYNFKYPLADNPTIPISYYDYKITNLTTSVYNTAAQACSSVEIEVRYEDEVSDTNATKEEDEHYIMRGCFEDTTNDYYFDCIDIEIQPDHGIDQTWNFTTTLPYVGEEIESEIDVWIYTWDEDNLDTDCWHCGELVYTFSGDEGYGTMNITPDLSESCKYSKRSIVGEDDDMFLQFRYVNATEDIASKTGTFHFSADCPIGYLGEDMECVIYAQIEDPQQVQKEVDFNCYITKEGQVWSIVNWNQMITREISSMHRDFYVPSSLAQGTSYTLFCEANYYNLGSRQDTFSTTFVTALRPDDNSGPSGGGISIPADTTEEPSTIEGIKDKIDDIIRIPEDIIEPIQKAIEKAKEVIKDNAILSVLVVISIALGLYYWQMHMKKEEKDEEDIVV